MKVSPWIRLRNAPKPSNVATVLRAFKILYFRRSNIPGGPGGESPRGAAVGPGRGLSACLLALGLGAGAAQAGTCDPAFADLDAAGRIARVAVEVADTPETRARGLMFRAALPEGAGMLFVYRWPRHVRLWMKDTPIPLDMLFFDRTGVLRHIHENALPYDETPIDGGEDVRFVLELNAGQARALGLEPGARLRHPSVRQSIAEWPCEDES